MRRIILKPGEEGRIYRGHPWVYDNEVACVLDGKGDKPETGQGKTRQGDPVPGLTGLSAGEAVDVESSRKEYLGRGFANPRSKILVRIYSPSKEGADKGFFKRRIREALERRTPCYELGRESCRAVFGEADFLPGLIADRFVGWPLEDALRVRDGVVDFDGLAEKLGPPLSWLSLEFLSYGMDTRRDLILEAFAEVLPDPVLRGIVERSAPVRELEGLENRPGILEGSFPEKGIVIFENGFPMAVHLEEGQKTGYYLDQRDNRLWVRNHGKARQVLDLCANTGGFSVHALRGGAQSVLAVDSSSRALEVLKLNAALNGFEDSISTETGDIFDILPRYERDTSKRFDLVILDPPAFAKTRASLESAMRGYKEINLRAIKLLRKGGILVSCSCSQAVGEGRFKAMIASSAADAGRRLIQLEFRQQSPDHPVLSGYDESHYLKCGCYLVL
ncbi:MAG: class I SAM-dependent rRNA methyltransferase [Spirochaetaceae bacterium]|jgi:23S rRNA (cytosine1962-C5)-methyltransferase|nr:class I SAM-dependent rRNA methyltransferase [Spirochaetaceae bacterium]